MAGAFDMDDLDEFEENVEQAIPSKGGYAAAEAPIAKAQTPAIASAAYFQEAAKKNISWYHPDEKAWMIATDGKWTGFSTSDCTKVEKSEGQWTPWSQVLDDSDAPFYRWFTDAQTNAAFNEVDVHILNGHGDELAYIEEADPLIKGDQSCEVTRHELFVRSAAAAHMLSTTYGLKTGDRVLFFLPAGHDQIVWVEACKRLGVVYCCCNPGLPPEQIADRVFVLGAKAVITAEHPEWSYVVHKALANYVTVEEGLELASKLPGFDKAALVTRWSSRHTVSLKESPFAEASVSKNSDVLLAARVIVLDAVKVPFNFVHNKMPKPEVKAQTDVVSSIPVADAETKGLKGPAAVVEVWKQFGAPVPVEANYPLFIIFTSGTTGKPKGVCHAHAYVAGLVETMKVVFKAEPNVDRMMTVGALGWITGQSYQIAAPLASRVTAVVMRGNPVRPKRSRFAEVIHKHKVTIFKAGSAFLREVMSDGKSMEEVKTLDTVSQLRIATFCAEPVSSAVQQFAMEAICKNYINSYWATEHGGIAWSREYDNEKQVLKADTRSWPLPWLNADVYAFDETSRPSDETGVWKAAVAEVGERAEVVLTAPYPYMFRYVWGDVENFGKPEWTGDRSIMTKKYWRKTELPGVAQQWVYVQGDFAVKYDDSAFTFHGRSDEVLNVNGILFGTEHIEGAILRDRQANPDSPIGHCVVTGYPDKVSGEVPLAFVVLTRGTKLSSDDQMRLFGLVSSIVGQINVKFVTVSALPQTFSGKFMRRLLKSIACGEPLGDTSTIANPECITSLKEEFALWAKAATQ